MVDLLLDLYECEEREVKKTKDIHETILLLVAKIKQQKMEIQSLKNENQYVTGRSQIKIVCEFCFY